MVATTQAVTGRWTQLTVNALQGQARESSLFQLRQYASASEVRLTVPEVATWACSIADTVLVTPSESPPALGIASGNMPQLRQLDLRCR